MRRIAFVFMLLSIASCRREDPGPASPAPQVAPAPRTTMAQGVPRALDLAPCGADGSCPTGLTCTEQPGGPCASEADCAGGPCDTDRGACTSRLCTDACTARTARYRYNDREMLRMDAAGKRLPSWEWGSLCDAEGRCAREASACIADSDVDCRASLACRWFGACVARSGACVAEGGSCKASRVCKESGRCAEVSGTCTAATAEDCRTSTRCRTLGWCALQDGLCRVGEGGFPAGEAIMKLHPKVPPRRSKPAPAEERGP